MSAPVTIFAELEDNRPKLNTNPLWNIGGSFLIILEYLTLHEIVRLDSAIEKKYREDLHNMLRCLPFTYSQRVSTPTKVSQWLITRGMAFPRDKKWNINSCQFRELLTLTTEGTKAALNCAHFLKKIKAMEIFITGEEEDTGILHLMDNILSYCPSLENMVISIENQSLFQSRSNSQRSTVDVPKLKLLKSLTIRTPEMNINPILSYFENSPELSELSLLRKDWVHEERNSEVHSISDSIFQHLFSKLTQLEIVDGEYPEILTHGHANLTQLILHSKSGYNRLHWIPIASQFPRLESLKLIGQKQLPFPALCHALTTHCPRLQNLELCFVALALPIDRNMESWVPPLFSSSLSVARLRVSYPRNYLAENAVTNQPNTYIFWILHHLDTSNFHELVLHHRTSLSVASHRLIAEKCQHLSVVDILVESKTQQYVSDIAVTLTQKLCKI